MVANLNGKLVGAQEKMKDLQDFYDRHEEIMAKERKTYLEMIKDTNNSKEELEARLCKQLDQTTIELETIKSEFNVKMQKIKLQEIELENKLLVQETNAAVLNDKLEDLERKVAKSDKVIKKRDNKIEELKQDVNREIDVRHQNVKAMQEEYELLRQRVIQLQSDLNYQIDLAAKKASLK